MKLIELFVFFKCKKCKSKFSSNNKFHQHVRNQYSDKFYEISFYFIEQNENEFSDSNFFRKKFNAMKFIFIVVSTVNLNQKLKSGFEFRKYQYVIAYFSFIKNVFQQTNCFDTETELIIMNKIFFYRVNQKNSLKQYLSKSRYEALTWTSIKQKNTSSVSFIVRVKIVSKNKFESVLSEKFIWLKISKSIFWSILIFLHQKISF